MKHRKKEKAQSEQGFIQGAAILVGSLFITKIIGALFKIPLTNIIGGSGMGYFNSAYVLFLPVYSLAVGGLPAAVARMVAQYRAQGDSASVKRLLHLSLTLFIALGAVCMVGVALCAPLFVRAVGNPKALLCVLLIAPSLLFGGIMAAYRGYYEGLRNMVPTAISQVVEALCKLVAGLLFAYVTVLFGQRQFALTGTVFGQEASTPQQASEIVMPFAAAAAILGITISTMVGAAYLMIRHKWKGDGVAVPKASGNQGEPNGTLVKRLALLALPVAVGSIVVNISSLIDLLTIHRCLSDAISIDPVYFARTYHFALQGTVGLLDLPNLIYGSYTGLAVTVFGLVPAFTGMLGKSLLPSVTSGWVEGNLDEVRKSVSSMLRVTCLFVFPCGFSVALLAQPILDFLFHSRTVEIAIAAEPLSVMGIGLIFLALATPLFSVLQAVGRADLPVKLTAAGTVVKLLLNLALISRPQIGIIGAAVGTAVCYGVIVIGALVEVRRLTGLRLHASECLIRPAIAGGFCAATASHVQRTLQDCLDRRLSFLIALMAGGLVFVIFAFALRLISREDVISLPNGEKIAKTLEKYRLIR